ncbi:MAG: class I SAM-dependent rRNA methyltransferase [Planctomycetota bacterium]|jgi:23S rRNA (cytosine1962-C5)-methyltransferase
MLSVYLRGNEAPRHPRIFKKRIRRADAGIRPGDVVAVRTEDGTFVGRAFYSPRSVIAARILDREEHGPPVDRDWFAARIGGAAALRKALRLDDVTDAYRVVHAEGDGLGGLIVDRFADVAVIEVRARGLFEHLDEVEEAVRAVLGVERIVVRADPRVEEIEGFSAADRRAPDVATIVTEHGLRFHVDCSRGHKTGFFVDQREARHEVAALAARRRVLDLCCYTGGFALAAARGGAAKVTGVDLDEAALELAAENARLNGLERVEFEHGDAFDVLRRAPGADLIVLDPPKLASHRRELGKARRKSVDLNTLALEALPPEGLLFTFSCTGLWGEADLAGHVREAARRARRFVRILRVTGQPPDHPVHVECPESRYLTGLLLQVT